MATPQQTGSPMRSLSLVMIGAVLGGITGFLYAAGAGITLDGHDHATDHGAFQHEDRAHKETHDHSHEEMVEIGSISPSLKLVIYPDSIAGYNLELVTSGFTFAPHQTGDTHRSGEGHANLYINGRKITRLYGPWYHIGALAQGRHEIMVTLNANDHRLLAHEGSALEEKLSVIVN